ncbi:MAG: HEAT repeat domain-containing protein [Acidobacteria bacterium]|nr:HEAT repeat domain-containing protein [Acidobacteriota bacterium]
MRVERRARARSKFETARRVPRAPRVAVSFFLALACLSAFEPARAAQGDLTPQQQEIKVLTARLSSVDAEERREAVTRLGALRRPEASRAAAAALGDAAAIVRATAARAVLSLPPGEAATLVVPLLRDRDEFVRREAAYALGVTRSAAGVPALAAALETDKQASVRGAAAVALGQIGDAAAAPALAGALSRRLRATGFFNRLRRRKVEEDEFVRRSAAVSLGLIGSRDAVAVLVETLSDERAPQDVRREAARALGLIGDPAAAPALRNLLTHRDPYLSRIAFEALKKLDPSNAARPAGGGI